MARPKKSEHTREKLLEEGMTLLSEHGYHGTGIKKILDTVNVPKGSFYNYFDSKENFVSEIIKRYNREFVEKLDAYVSSTDDDPVTVIRNIYQFIIAELEKNGMQGCLVGNLAAEIGTSSESCRMQMQEALAASKKRLTALLADGQRKGLLRADLHASALADIFWSTWQGGLLKMKVDGNTDHLKEIVSIMLDSLFRPVTHLKG